MKTIKRRICRANWVELSLVIFMLLMAAMVFIADAIGGFLNWPFMVGVVAVFISAAGAVLESADKN